MKKENTQSIGNPLPLRVVRKTYPVLEKIMPGIAHKFAYNLFFIPIRYKSPSRELPVLALAKKSQAHINNKKTIFYSWGNPADPLVVLVHGWMGRAGQFYKLIEKLLESRYHIVSFDGPAHGASSGVKTNVVEFVEALKHIESHFGPIFYGIGHSFGGVVLIYARWQGLNLEHIACIATPTISDDIIKQFEEKINATSATGNYFIKELHKRHGVHFKDISAGELIGHIKIKSLLLVHDENDKDVPIEHAYLIQKKFKGATIHYTKGLGHTRILRNEPVVMEIVNKVDQFRPNFSGHNQNI